MATVDNWVCLGSGGGFIVYDLSVPENPVLVTNSWDPAWHLEAGGDYLYRIGGYGMPTLVITDPGNNFAEIDSLPWIDGITQLSSFSLAGNQFALLADEGQGNMVVIDLQTTGLPSITNYMTDAKIVDVVGRVDVTGTNAFLATTNGLEILDLSDPSQITVIAEWDCPPGFLPKRICVDGNRIGLASTNHLWILDIDELGGSDPVIAETAITNSFGDMILSGNHLYAAAGVDGVLVYQIGSAPSQPTLFIADTPPGQVTLEWSAAGTGWWLQQSATPVDPEGWETLAGSDTITGTNFPQTVPARFFRLKQP